MSAVDVGVPGHGTGTTTGTGVLTRLALRRDRIMIPAWVYALTAAVLSTCLSLDTLYGTLKERTDFARSMNVNSSLRALYGPAFSGESIGALTAWRMGCIGAALTGLMSILIVVRHTREEEESGRQELLSSGVVGRRAPLTAGLLTALTANAVLALAVSAALTVLGQSVAGSAALGLALAGSGLMFAGVAAVTAQLTASARVAKGLAGAVLGLAFLLRASGDAASADASSPLVWASPLGWTENLRPFAGDRWWLLGLVAAFTAVTTGAGYVLVARRDLGAGLLPARPGPAEGAASLNGPFALAWRLQRGALYSWAAGFAVAGALYGSVGNSISGIVEDNAQLGDMVRRMGGPGALTDSFFATAMGLLGMLAAAYAVQSTLRLRSEETGRLAEPLLANAVGRVRWACSHLVFPALGTLVLLAVGGASAGLAYGATIGDISGQLPTLTGAALAQAPAVWVTAALALVLFGWMPKASAAAWGVFAAFLLCGQLGPVLHLPQLMLDLSPFTHLPKAPGGHQEAAPYLWLVLVGAVAAAVGLTGFRRRDLAGD